MAQGKRYGPKKIGQLSLGSSLQQFRHRIELALVCLSKTIIVINVQGELLAFLGNAEKNLNETL